MKKIISLALALALGFAVTAKAADSVGALPFLRMPVGARATGMGGACTALSDDVSAAVYNPAGLAAINGLELSMMYGGLPDDRGYNYLGAAMPLFGQTFALTLLNSSLSDITGYDSSGSEEGSFNWSSLVTILSWARDLGDSASMGMNLKMITSSLKDNSAFGFGLDAGIKFSPAEKLFVALMLQDIGASVKWDTASDAVDKIPSVIKLGASKRMLKDKLIVAADLGKASDTEDLSYNAGIEYLISTMLAPRIGIDDGSLSAGIGLYGLDMRRLSFTFDYSMILDSGITENSNSHYLSLGVKFF